MRKLVMTILLGAALVTGVVGYSSPAIAGDYDDPGCEGRCQQLYDDIISQCPYSEEPHDTWCVQSAHNAKQNCLREECNWILN